MLAISRRANEVLIVQTADTAIVVTATSPCKVRVDAHKSARVYREEIAEKCDVCGRWTIRGPCEWCTPELVWRPQKA